MFELQSSVFFHDCEDIKHIFTNILQLNGKKITLKTRESLNPSI